MSFHFPVHSLPLGYRSYLVALFFFFTETLNKRHFFLLSGDFYHATFPTPIHNFSASSSEIIPIRFVIFEIPNLSPCDKLMR